MIPIWTRTAVPAVALMAMLAGCATALPPVTPITAPPTTVAEVGEILRPGSGIPNGYLPPASLPDSLALLPPPPMAGSIAQQADAAAVDAAAAAPADRHALAAADADLAWLQLAAPFSAILGVDLAGPDMPHTAMLLRRAGADAVMSTYRAKNHYIRERPFILRNTATCRPEGDEMLRQDGSYPSGHAALGWMMALVATKLVPDNADALLQRGYEFGRSRTVCLAHWQSDVEAGRLMASATFARLQSDPVFQAQLNLAKAEIARQRNSTRTPQ